MKRIIFASIIHRFRWRSRYFCLSYWIGQLNFGQLFVQPPRPVADSLSCSCDSLFLPPVHPKYLLWAPDAIQNSISSMSNRIMIFDKSWVLSKWGTMQLRFLYWTMTFLLSVLWYCSRNKTLKRRQEPKRTRASWTYSIALTTLVSMPPRPHT